MPKGTIDRLEWWGRISLLGLIALLALPRWGTVPAQAAPFAYIAVTIDNDFECTLPTESAVAVIDTAINAVVASVPVPPCPAGVAVHPAGTFVYVTTGNSVSVINTATNTVTATVPVGAPPGGVAVHPAGTFVYVTAGFFDTQTVSVIATATNTVVATVPVGILPGGVAVHPAGTVVYVTTDTTVSVIATATNTVIATVPAGDFPFGVAVHPAGTFVYVTNVNSATVSVIATATNTVVATVPVGNPPTAFGQFVGPELPGGSLTLNQATFHGGNTLTLEATTYVGATSRRLDAYVEVHLPDETRLFLQADGSFTREIRPIVSDWPVVPSTTS